MSDTLTVTIADRNTIRVTIPTSHGDETLTLSPAVASVLANALRRTVDALASLRGSEAGALADPLR